MKELICIVCPKGCHLKVDEENGYAVTGNSCPRGAVYGKKELVNPTRVLTSTVNVTGGTLKRVSVKTDGDIPKSQLFPAMEALENVEMKAPVSIGDVVLENFLGLGVNLVATKTVPLREE